MESGRELLTKMISSSFDIKILKVQESLREKEGQRENHTKVSFV